MFKRILIANRGEIACRIIKTAKKMGITTLAIYSSPDQNSLHVQLADEAYYVGDAAAKDSYLNIEAIIALATQHHADAIHPGYGFLSENPLFAQACEQAGIVFIGPSVAAMEAMASKQLAKQRLEKTAVPLTPGYHGKEQSDAVLLTEAKRIGFPVLLKAASGGGGKGMRAVEQESDFLPALTGARREAMASFADDTMIIEKLVRDPRHVEVQIMADNHGNVVHLFERDCSIQRRHQKIIEEAPAPGLSPTLRQQLATAACEVARSIHYSGAGTVEFLLDGEAFYFMEMNTRLQVEHPVTEMITGLDLVAWQIKIAANETLPCEQAAITQHGHAFECRIYAEDPYHDFMPSTGRIHFLQEPQGEGIRIDSGIRQGSTITMYYDPMVAKLIVWGENRAAALQRLQHALRHYLVGGVKTNLPFLQAICAHPRFAAVHLATSFLQQETLNLPHTDTSKAVMLAAAYDFLHLQHQHDALYQHSFAWQMHLTSHWFWRYTIEGQHYSVKILPLQANRFTLSLAENKVTITVTLQAHALTIDDGKSRSTTSVALWDDTLHCFMDGKVVAVNHYTWDDIGQQATTNTGQLTAPMPATIVAILKNKGDVVKEGERLMVLEAMKMEHTIHAPKNGILAELYYEVGSQVQEGAKLLALQE